MILKVLYVILQCTWGFFQTLVGFCYFLRYRKCRHEWYHGAIVTYFDAWSGGVSLGLFVFVSNQSDKMMEEFKEKNIDFDKSEQNALKVHEYGHTIQSLIFGPLFFLVIALPSFRWADTPRFKQMRKEQNILYTSYWCEKWANKLGTFVTHEKAWNH